MSIATIRRITPGAIVGDQRRGRRGFRLLMAALLAVTLAGCISTRFVYNQLDWFITWQISGYFDLEKDQKAQLRETVSRSLDWVRTEQLPAYASLLRAIAAEAGTGQLTASRWQAIYDQMIVIFDDFLRQVIPDAAAFLSTLSDSQVEYLMDKLEEENAELTEEYSGSTPQERQKRRQKAIVKGIQRFTGRLDSDQKATIETSVASMYDNSEEWLEGRRLWQKAFRKLLLERPPKEEFEARLLAISINPNYVDTPEYRAQVEANQRIVLEMMSTIIVSLDDEQQERFQRRMNGFADDFDALAMQANGGGASTEPRSGAALSATVARAH